MLTILIVKLLCFLGSLLGRGSSLPGEIALKLDKNILGRLTLPQTVIAVTGSNGKTSVTELIRTAALGAGLSVVCNSKGSNQIEGVATALLQACDLRGRIKADCVILESDERFCQYTFSHFAPSHILVTNLFRDQMTRNGHGEFVLGEIKKGLPESSVLILNADDPLSSTLAENHKTIWFGVSPEAFCEKPDTYHAYDDGACCPVCKSHMGYDSRVHNHLGVFHCEQCGFQAQTPDHRVTAREDGAFVLDGRFRIVPQLDNTIFAYNIAAAFTAATEALHIEPQYVCGFLDGHSLQSGRVKSFDIDGHKGLYMLCKHENSLAYDGALETIINSDSEEMTVVLIVDQLSRKYIANDMSWLWDIDFELLADARVKKLLLGGAFANDLACRMLFAGISPETLCVKPDLDEMMDELYARPVGDIYVCTCFTDTPKFEKRLRGQGK